MKTNCFTAINLDSETNIPPAMQSSPMYMLGYTVISIQKSVCTENTFLMGSPKDLYWGLCYSLFTYMTSPEPHIYCFQYNSLMTQAFSSMAQATVKLFML